MWTRPLAVEFIGIEASIQDLKVVLTWSTATETENQGFILEKKTDSLAVWNPLSSYINNDDLRGQGTVSSTTNYTYTDSLVTNGETYFYRILGIDNANNIGLLDSLSILVGEVGIKPKVPSDFILTAYPNPFNPRTIISMQYAEISHAAVNIYNVQGVLVEKLFNDWVDAGNCDLAWDAGMMPSGVYVCVLSIDGKLVASQKLVLVR